MFPMKPTATHDQSLPQPQHTCLGLVMGGGPAGVGCRVGGGGREGSCLAWGPAGRETSRYLAPSDRGEAMALLLRNSDVRVREGRGREGWPHAGNGEQELRESGARWGGGGSRSWDKQSCALGTADTAGQRGSGRCPQCGRCSEETGGRNAARSKAQL